MDETNPCLGCGACCARYRVSFHWLETTLNSEAPAADEAPSDLARDGVDPSTLDLPPAVPVELTEPVGPHRMAMKGADTCPPRCVALQGQVGQTATCSIHAVRPSPCRDFERSWAHGEPNDRCDASRLAFGLPPLLPPATFVAAPAPGLSALPDDQELLPPLIGASGHLHEVGARGHDPAVAVPAIPDEPPVTGELPS